MSLRSKDTAPILSVHFWKSVTDASWGCIMFTTMLVVHEKLIYAWASRGWGLGPQWGSLKRTGATTSLCTLLVVCVIAWKQFINETNRETMKKMRWPELFLCVFLCYPRKSALCLLVCNHHTDIELRANYVVSAKPTSSYSRGRIEQPLLLLD